MEENYDLFFLGMGFVDVKDSLQSDIFPFRSL